MIYIAAYSAYFFSEYFWYNIYLLGGAIKLF